ncbi:MAG TPA: hypothetical protein VGF53_10230 [Pseudolabrys sp.]|jgi:hypothetical protein
MRHYGNASAGKFFPAILLAALTSACSGVLSGAQLTTMPATPPADYRKIISTGAPAPMTAGAQVSELRQTSGSQSGDWFACVKSDTAPYVGFFAVFIENEKVVDFRRSVATDRCEAASYSPLAPPVVQEKKTPPKRKKAAPAPAKN